MHKCTQRIEHLGAWLKHCLAKIELCACGTLGEHYDSKFPSRHTTLLGKQTTCQIFPIHGRVTRFLKSVSS
jgi:hypothetical protein